jgi:hypothetical protein
MANLVAMSDQGRQECSGTKRAFMQNKVVMWIHANYPGSHVGSRFSRKETQEKRAFYANQSRDVDSRKLFLAVMTDQGSAEKRHRRRGHCYANRMDIHGQPTLELVWYGLGGWEEKGNCKETDKEQKTDIKDTDRQGLIKLAHPSTSHFAPLRAVRHPTPPPPRHFAPPPHRNLAVKPRTNPQPLLGLGKNGTAFSVQQPCE